MPLLSRHGFRPSGPWVVNVGEWSEVTYLLRFDSLAQREAVRAKFRAHAEGLQYATVIRGYATEVSSRVLTPAPFAEVDLDATSTQ